MIDYQRIYHVGVRVPDVDAAMAEMSAALGLTWATVQYFAERPVWTPERGLELVELTFTYSCEGPQHVELLTGGSVWACGDQPGAHHVGVWCDDIAGETERCLSLGWTLAAAAKDPADGFGTFVYVVPPSGLIVELVSSAAQPRFEQWFAGGLMGGERA